MNANPDDQLAFFELTDMSIFYHKNLSIAIDFRGVYKKLLI